MLGKIWLIGAIVGLILITVIAAYCKHKHDKWSYGYRVLDPYEISIMVMVVALWPFSIPILVCSFIIFGCFYIIYVLFVLLFNKLDKKEQNE